MKKLIYAIIIVVISQAATWALTSEDISLIESTDITQCQLVLAPILDKEVEEFQLYLNDHFLSKSSTSSLSNVAIARFDQYQQNINSALKFLNFKNEGVQNEINYYQQCQIMAAQYIETGKQLLLDKIKSNASQKQASLLLEKHKAINSKLRNVQMETAKMYGFYMTFKNRLPGYLNQCVQI